MPYRFVAAMLMALVFIAERSYAQQNGDAKAPIVDIAGDVTRPGEYPYEDGLTVRVLLERAGGLAGVSPRAMSIMRTTSDKIRASSQPEVMVTNLLTATMDTLLQAGDFLEISAYKADFAPAGSQKIVDWMSKGAFDNVILSYKGARPAVFEDRLRSQWRTVQQRVGAFQQQSAARVEIRGDDFIGVVSCQFAKGRADVVITFDKAGSVTDVSIGTPTP